MVKSNVEKKTARNIGIDVKPPEESCEDQYCPFHGVLPVRGATLEGIVVSTRMHGTVIIEREYKHFLPKYERFEKRTRRYFAHHPPCITIEQGDRVKIMECRPLSKQVSFAVIERKE